jgi:hypothetical protein
MPSIFEQLLEICHTPIHLADVFFSVYQTPHSGFPNHAHQTPGKSHIRPRYRFMQIKHAHACTPLIRPDLQTHPGSASLTNTTKSASSSSPRTFNVSAILRQIASKTKTVLPLSLMILISSSLSNRLSKICSKFAFAFFESIRFMLCANSLIILSHGYP